MASTVEDLEFLVRSEHRVDALRALVEGPCDRDGLQSAIGASKATVARLLNDLEERDWVVRDGHQYELTDLGQFVAEEVLALLDRMETERAVRDVWQWFPTDLPGFTFGLFADAVVSFPESHSPYQPLPRFVELVEAAHTMRGFSERSLKPGTYDVILRNAADGMETKLALSSAVIDEMVDVSDEKVIEAAIESSHLTVLESETFPTDAGFALFEDCLALYCRDDNGVTKAGIDTDNPAAIAWGESIYETVRIDANSVDATKIMK